MKSLIPMQIQIAPPLMGLFIGGGGRGSDAQTNHTAPVVRCRGHAIGKYVVDFCAPRKKLIIELDGSQHFEQEEYDRERTDLLEARGYKLIRFWNNDVMNDIEGVLLAIAQILEERR